MKVKVWTSWNVCVDKDGHGKPKCIFDGEVQVAPTAGEYIVLRNGFGAETVESVVHDFVNGDVEIRVRTSDSENDYGGCLFKLGAHETNTD